MVNDFTLVGQWLLQTAERLWSAFGNWHFLGFVIIFFPIMRKVVRLFKSLINTI